MTRTGYFTSHKTSTVLLYFWMVMSTNIGEFVWFIYHQSRKLFHYKGLVRKLWWLLCFFFLKSCWKSSWDALMSHDVTVVSITSVPSHIGKPYYSIPFISVRLAELVSTSTCLCEWVLLKSTANLFYNSCFVCVFTCLTELVPLRK